MLTFHWKKRKCRIVSKKRNPTGKLVQKFKHLENVLTGDVCTEKEK